MMQKSKSSVWMRSKVLYIIPMATLALSAFATSESLFPSGNVLPIASAMFSCSLQMNKKILLEEI